MAQMNEPFPKLAGKTRRRLLSINLLMKAFTYAFAILGILFVLLLAVVVGLLHKEAAPIQPVPSQAVLFVNFDDAVSEIREDTLISDITEVPSVSYFDLLKALGAAAGDPRIKAVVAEVSNSGLGLAQIQELRNVIKTIRAGGKKAYIYAPGMGDFGGGTSEYYLASAFDEIWMQPDTDIGLTGISIEMPFVKDLLDKVGVTPEFYTRYEYKNAVAPLMSNKFSKEHLEETLKLGNSIFQRIFAEICADRKIKPENLMKLINRAPVRSNDGIAVGLVDFTAYRPDMIQEITSRYKGAEIVSVYDYLAQLKPEKKNMPAVAFLVIEGTIDTGKSIYNPVRQELVSGSETIAQYLDKIANNPRIKALVLRVNSPGGSYNAANEIWYTLKKMKQNKDLPIVVSQGDYAASGGYFVSLAGDYIYAEPSTVTGSIGVLGGKIVLQNLWQKLGVHWGQVNFGQNAGLLTTSRVFSESEKAAFNRSLDAVYRDFTAKTAQERKIAPEKMDSLARGRVWTGEDAVRLKLVDAIGGVNDAIMKAKELAGIGEKEKFEVIYYPEPKTLAEKLNEILESSPKVMVNSRSKLEKMLGDEWQLWQRLQYDAVLPPLKVMM